MKKDLSYSNNKQEKQLIEKLNQLKRENLDLHTYQTLFSEIDAMDYGPRYYDRTFDLNNKLADRISNLNNEIKKTKDEIKKTENK